MPSVDLKIDYHVELGTCDTCRTKLGVQNYMCGDCKKHYFEDWTNSVPGAIGPLDVPIITGASFVWRDSDSEGPR